jgi:hypothetical protein
LVAAALGACGGKSGEGAGGGAEAPQAVPADVVAKVNGAVPKELAGTLTFESRKLVDRKAELLAVVPVGWKESTVVPGNFEPPEGSGLGFMTRFSASSNCDGVCEAKDWKATAESVEFAQFKAANFTIESDQASATSRTVVARSDTDGVYVRTAMWKDGAERYFTCSAALEKAAVAAAPAFAAACQAMIPVWE